MKSTNNYISQEDFERIIAELPRFVPRTFSAEDCTLLFKTCYWCGLRITEALALSWGDIDADERKITLMKTKTGKNVTVRFPHFLDDFFFCAYVEDPKQKLFEKIKYHTLLNMMKKIGNELDIQAWKQGQDQTGEKTFSHIWRKSSAKDILQGTHGRKGDIVLVQEFLRHNSIVSTQHYLKTKGAALEEFFKDLEEKGED